MYAYIGLSIKCDNFKDIIPAKRKSVFPSMNHGRSLILDDTCRAAFSRDAESRTHMDLQSLKTWFQKTKIKMCTDFDSLQPLEVNMAKIAKLIT